MEGRSKVIRIRRYGINLLAIINGNKIMVKPNTREKAGSWAAVHMATKYPGLMGLAKCHPDDKFSLKIGIKLATLRLIKAFRLKESHRAERLKHQAYQDLERINDFINLKCQMEKYPGGSYDSP